MAKRLYTFEEGCNVGKQILGGKGQGLCEMTKIGFPVPRGFVITTEQCVKYSEKGSMPDGLMDDIKAAIKKVEEASKKGFGDENKPLLVAVRSGAAISMPGMMDTILNLGLNEKTVAGLAKLTNNKRFAYDTYRRFLSLFGKIALDLPDKLFDDLMVERKLEKKVKLDTDLTCEDMEYLSAEFKKVIEKETKKPFPCCPMEQLEIAVMAVFRSWMGKRAVDYRREFKITPDMANGTAVTVIEMVFGNMGNSSGTGVAFTRDPGTGENVFYGEYLINAQGEDVVAGIRTPKPILEMEKELPVTFKELCDVRKKLEAHYHEVQDFEFTVEAGKLYMLQTRNGKMNGPATVRTSIEMLGEGLINKEQAILRCQPQILDQLLFKSVSVDYKEKPLARGLAASPGSASGAVVFDANDAVEMSKTKKVVLVREETKPEDIHGFFVSQAILTSRGGKTSHAAVVARGIGKPCVSGAESIHVDVHKKVAKIGTMELKEGDIITIDGTTGNVYKGEAPLVEPQIGGDFEKLLQIANEFKKLGVMANADTPAMAKKAREFGAEGIGLVRTERMFNAVERLPIVVDMIMANSLEERNVHLERLHPLQKNDFVQIFEAMNTLPVTVRLLDPPLHEFLPSLEVVLREIYEMKLCGKTEGIEKKEKILAKIKELSEVNPMIGHRGVRLGITNLEIYGMQVRAIYEAAAEATKKGVKVHCEIMIPNVTDVNELIFIREKLIEPIKEEVLKKYGYDGHIMYGTMIECVRAAMTSKLIAKEAEFYSFGTNDMTQGTFSYSREDCENKFLPKYVELGILPNNPFEILDRPGVGRVMDIAVREGRETRPNLIVGICGEHGGEPSSIEWCHMINLNYVSCSPYRIPIARMAAAHAALKHKK